jgi:hypothetical protein
LSVIEARSGKTLNIKVVENSINFLKRVETQNFDIGRRKHEGLKSIEISGYDFELEVIFKFLLVFKVHFLIQFECMTSCNMSALFVPHQQKKLAKYIWRTYSRWQIVLIPIVSSTGITYANVVSAPVEKPNRYRYNHTSPLIPMWRSCI